MKTLEVFDHSDRVPPMVILDVHNSHIGNEYLDYCNSKQHLWTPFLGAICYQLVAGWRLAVTEHSLQDRARTVEVIALQLEREARV
jgi:hypothetical protein